MRADGVSPQTPNCGEERGHKVGPGAQMPCPSWKEWMSLTSLLQARWPAGCGGAVLSPPCLHTVVTSAGLWHQSAQGGAMQMRQDRGGQRPL